MNREQHTHTELSKCALCVLMSRLSKAVKQMHSFFMKMPTESRHVFLCVCAILTVHH